MSNIRCPNCMSEHDESLSVCKQCGYSGGNVQDKPYQLAPGTVLGRDYILGRAYVDDAFGITYIAFDKKNNVRVSVREFFPKAIAVRYIDELDVVAESERTDGILHRGVERFHDDYAQLRRMREYPALPAIYDCFLENETAYAVTEYIEGIPFSEYLKERGGKIDEESALSLLYPIMLAVENASSMGVFHANICPEKIIITDNSTPYLVDFSGADMLLRSFRKSAADVGKSCCAPEALRRNGDVGAWTDVYGIAATLYCAVTGAPPRDPFARGRAADIRPYSSFGIKVSRNFEHALRHALEYDETERYDSISKLVKRLSGQTEENDGTPAPVRSERRYGSVPTALRVGIITVAIVVAALGVTLGGMLLSNNGAKTANASATPMPTYINADLMEPIVPVTPTMEPTIAPTLTPTAAPTEEPTPTPTLEPTPTPTEEPTPSPTPKRTSKPTAKPTPTPTPTIEPTRPMIETPQPTIEITPTPTPTVAPTPTEVLEPVPTSTYYSQDGN